MKSLTLKIGLLLFFLLFSFGFLISVTISPTLNSKSSVLQYAFKKILGADVSFKKVSFGILGGLELRDFVLEKDSHKLFFIRELRIYPSLPQLMNKRITVNKIIARDCVTSLELAGYKDYILSKIYSNRRQAGEGGYGQLFGFEQKNFNIHIRNLRLYLGSLQQNKGFLLINSDIKNHLENITSKTSLDFTYCNLDKPPYNRIFYFIPNGVLMNLQVAFMKDDLLVNNLVFSSDVFKVSGAGIIYDFKGKPILDIKLISVPLNLRELIKAKSKFALNGLVNFVINIKGSLSSPRLSLEMMMPKGELYFPANIAKFSNVFCNINIKNNEIIIKEISALLNYSTPIFLTGRIKNFSQPEFDLVIESHKSKTLEPLAKESFDFIFKTNAALSGDDLIGSSKVLIFATRQMPHTISKNEISFQFDNLKLPLNKWLIKKRGFNFAAQKLSIKAKEIVNERLKNEQNIELDNFEAKFLFGEDMVIRSQMHSLGYGGIIDGWGEWQLSGFKPVRHFMTKFVNLSVNDLKSIYPTKSDISGILNGWLFLKFDKAVFLEGAVAIKNASIANFGLINNVADFLRIKSIKELKDVSFFAAFQKNNSGTDIRRFNLHNANLDMEARFNLNNHGWLTGLAHLVITRNILEESSILKTLLSIVKERARAIDFDFKISGFTDSLRLELLEGDFREKLIKGLSGGIQSQIENEINKTIASFHEKSPP